MTHIPARLRAEVIARAHASCEYCQTPQVIVIAMEIDHIIPVSAGGLTTLDNLCLACTTCNDYKLDHQTGVDSHTREESPLFNPRTQVWAEHFAWNEDFTMVGGITSVGRATISRLHVNDPLVVAARRLWMAAGWRPKEHD